MRGRLGGDAFRLAEPSPRLPTEIWGQLLSEISATEVDFFFSGPGSFRGARSEIEKQRDGGLGVLCRVSPLKQLGCAACPGQGKAEAGALSASPRQRQPRPQLSRALQPRSASGTQLPRRQRDREGASSPVAPRPRSSARSGCSVPGLSFALRRS
ncbi:hypothetical protein LEMLEM_LOCUS25466 [Lemmus lemmus]